MSEGDNNNDWGAFQTALLSSISAIAPEFYRLERFNGENSATQVWRERIYCYELYHQLRTRFTSSSHPYVLHGEVDKRGHKFITDHFHGKLVHPDFVVHAPGTDSNLVVMEGKDSPGYFRWQPEEPGPTGRRI